MDRNKLIKKGVVVAVIFLFIGLVFAPSINADMLEVKKYKYDNYEPEIEPPHAWSIDLDIKLTSIDMIIKNTGVEEHYELFWNFRIKRGLILIPFPLGWDHGTIYFHPDPLYPGGSVTVTIEKVFGFGFTIIQGRASCRESYVAIDEERAFIFLNFIFPI